MKSCQTLNRQGVEPLEKFMSRSNRDHAKKKHRPMQEDETIAQQLEDLLTKGDHCPTRLLPTARTPETEFSTCP